MRKKLIYLLGFCVAVGGVIAGGAYALAPTILESYRSVIEAELTEAVGGSVAYSRATIGVTRSLKIVLFDVSIKGAAQGLEVEGPRVSVRVELLPLLKRDLHVKKIELYRPTITLIAGKKAAKPPPVPVGSVAVASASRTPQEPIAQERPTSPFRGINRISIEDGTLRLRHQDGTELTIIEHINVESGLISENNVLSLKPSTATIVVHTGIKGKAPMPAVASLKSLSYAPLSQELAVEDATLISGTSRATLSGSVRLDSGDISTVGALERVDLDIIANLFGLQGLEGTGSLNAQMTRVDGRFKISGDLSATDVRSSKGILAAEHITVRNLEADENTTNGEAGYRGTISVQNGAVKPRSGESYGVGSLSGDIEYRRARTKGSTVQSKKITVGDFSFTDRGITIRKVSGDIENTKGSVKPNGAVDASLNVNGRSIELVTESFVIKRAESVSAPLSVSVTADGGYTIKGPAKAIGGQMVFRERELANVRGDVEMLIASTGLRFASKNLYAESVGQPIQLQGTLLVSPGSYDIPDFAGRIAGGNVSGKASMQRGSQTSTTLSLRAQEVRVDDFMSLIFGHRVATLGGVVNNFSTDATADKTNLLQTLQGSGHLEVSDGTLKKLRFRKEVVDLVEAIPVVGSAVSFTADATDSNTYAMQGGALKGFSCDFLLKDSAVTTNNLKASGRYSNIELQGKLFFDGRLDAQASAVFLEQNIKALGGPIKPLGRLMGNIVRIEIPLLVQGTIDSPTVSADFSRLHEVSMPGRAVGSVMRGIEEAVTGN